MAPSEILKYISRHNPSLDLYTLIDPEKIDATGLLLSWYVTLLSAFVRRDQPS